MNEDDTPELPTLAPGPEAAPHYEPLVPDESDHERELKDPVTGPRAEE